jgi:hypothetical protein
MGSAMSRKSNVDFIRRAPRRNPLAVPLAVGGGLLLLLVAVVALAALTLGRGGNPADPNAGTGIDLNPLRSPDPAADNEGMKWGLKDLCEHLKARGLVTQYELSAESKAVVLGPPYALARRPDGKAVMICEHTGPIAADSFTGTTTSAYTWGRFTCHWHGDRSDAPATVFGKLKGVKPPR